MSEVNKNINMYLDLEGLKKYDELIKKFIETQDESVIADLYAKLGDFDGSDDNMTVADIIAGVTKRVTDVEEAVDKLGDLGDGNTLGDLVSDITANTKAIETLTGEDEGSVKKAAADTLVAAQAYADGLASNYDAAGSAATAEQNAKDYADGLASNYDAAGAASAAETAAKGYADELNGAMNERVAALEEIDHNHENKDVLDGISAEKVSAWDAAEQNAKNYADGLKTTIDAAYVQADADTLAAAKTYADGLASNYDAAGAAATAEQNAKDYADSLATNYDAAGSAAAAQTAAEQKATDLNTAMNERVVKLEAIDHEKLAADASAAAVAAIVDNADSDFDTLREVAEWIKSDTTGAAALQVKVAEHTESINALDVKVKTDITNLNNHMTEAAAKIVEVDGRLDALENASIKIEDIKGLFPSNSKPEA